MFQYTTTMDLDPVNAYYIRKLLRQNFDRLQSVVVKGAGPTINPLSDLNLVIENLYLDEDEIQKAIQDLVQLVEMHKRISAQSQVNRQTLPELEAKIFWLLGFKEKTPGKKELILAVDDMTDNLDLLEAFLRQQGYRSARATNGTTALDQARTLLPDLILLDVSMPGMSGFEVCQQLKQSALTQDIPVLFLSANKSCKDKVKGFNVGAVDYVTKPFQMEEVCARVEYQLRLRNLQQRLATQNESLQKKILVHRHTEEQYRSMFEQAVDGMFQSSAHGVYISVNTALAQIYGYESAEVLMAAIDDVSTLYVKPDRRRDFINQINGDGTLRDFESQVYRQDKQMIWISESARMVYDSSGKFLYYEGVVRDITRYTLEPERCS